VKNKRSWLNLRYYIIPAFTWGTEENQEEPVRVAGLGDEIEPGKSQIRSRCANHSTTTFGPTGCTVSPYGITAQKNKMGISVDCEVALPDMSYSSFSQPL
jgi:hypothetical protein